MNTTVRAIRWTAGYLLLAAAFTLPLTAQDTFNAPRGQQIPPPACFTMRGAWEGGYTPCTPASHAEWLADVSHWRMERRIRVGRGRCGRSWDGPAE